MTKHSVWHFLFIKGISIWGGVFFSVMFGVGVIRGEYSTQEDFIFGLVVWSLIAIVCGGLFGFLEWKEQEAKMLRKK